MPATPACAESVFRHCSGICIVLQRAWHTELGFQYRLHWNPIPCGQVGRALNNPTYTIKRAAAAYAD